MPQYARTEEKKGSGAISKSAGPERMRFRGCQNYIIWLIPVQFTFTVQQLLYVKAGENKGTQWSLCIMKLAHTRGFVFVCVCVYVSVSVCDGEKVGGQTG